jgi:Virulence-associated protein E-like domain
VEQILLVPERKHAFMCKIQVISNGIHTEDKDYLIYLCSKWIWEVDELGATTRKANVEALKSFLSKQVVTVRKAYGKDEIDKPAVASFNGTINNTSGFLSDVTGSRRFMVTTLTSIDWNYWNEIDINQVWAQAVALYKSGAKWQLSKEEQIDAREINDNYQTPNPLKDLILDVCIIDTNNMKEFSTTVNILKALNEKGYVQGYTSAEARKLADALIPWGCKQARRITAPGVKESGWLGVKMKEENDPRRLLYDDIP